MPSHSPATSSAAPRQDTLPPAGAVTTLARSPATRADARSAAAHDFARLPIHAAGHAARQRASMHEQQARTVAAALQQGARLRPDAFQSSSPLTTAYSGGAAPLGADVRADMQARFGHDFASVRVVTDHRADKAAHGFGARAFARGEELSFAAGEFAPGTASGRALLAHELTHVLQQRAAGQARIDRDGTGLDQQVMDLRIEIVNAADAAARKPLVEQALALADPLSAALAVAVKSTSPDGEADADNARTLLFLLGGALAAHDELQAAGQIAQKSGDAKVKGQIIDVMVKAGGVAGQQKLMSALAPMAGQKIAPAGAKEGSKAWLSKNADAIGQTLTALDAAGVEGKNRKSRSLEMTSGLMADYLVTSDEDEKPDPTGNPGGANLRVDATTQQIKADCDVYATIGARLLRPQGWETVAYMMLLPNEKDPFKTTQDRAAHAVALARKPVDPKDPSQGDRWLGVGNAELVELGGEGAVLADEAAAMAPLETLLFSVYGAPLPNHFDIFYEAAGTGGAYNMKLLDPINDGLTPLRSAGNSQYKAKQAAAAPNSAAGGTP